MLIKFFFSNEKFCMRTRFETEAQNTWKFQLIAEKSSEIQLMTKIPSPGWPPR